MRASSSVILQMSFRCVTPVCALQQLNLRGVGSVMPLQFLWLNVLLASGQARLRIRHSPHTTLLTRHRSPRLFSNSLRPVRAVPSLPRRPHRRIGSQLAAALPHCRHCRAGTATHLQARLRGRWLRLRRAPAGVQGGGLPPALGAWRRLAYARHRLDSARHRDAQRRPGRAPGRARTGWPREGTLYY